MTVDIVLDMQSTVFIWGGGQ